MSHPLFNKMDKAHKSGLVSSDRNHPMEKLSIRGLSACRDKPKSPTVRICAETGG